MSGRQVGSCWRSNELNGAFVANGRRLSGFSRPAVCQFVIVLEFLLYQKFTDVVCVACVSKVSSCAVADLNVLELMAALGWA